MDRTGFASGTLAPREGMKAAVPGPDQRVWLDPVDMMGAMAAMETGHSGHGMVEMPKARHARGEYGPNVDMRVDYPRTNLRSEEHTSELQSLMRISYAVFC